jgi:hypothetical protein
MLGLSVFVESGIVFGHNSCDVLSPDQDYFFSTRHYILNVLVDFFDYTPLLSQYYPYTISSYPPVILSGVFLYIFEHILFEQPRQREA